MSSELIAQLQNIVGRSGVLVDEDVAARNIHVWSQTPIRAKAIVRPATTAETSAVLRLCHSRGQTIVPHGGLTGLVQGCNGTDADVVLSLERMNAIEEIDPIGRTMTVQAGVPLQRLQEAAEKHGLMFPLDLGARGTCQIGGNVSTNAGGNRVIRFGMARENVLGLEAVMADGTVISSLNKMIKNNAGYDLKQLFIGTEGTLGIVTRVVIRLREMALGQQTAFAACDEFTQVTGFLRAIDRALGGALCSFEVMWRDYYELVTSPPATNARPVPIEHRYFVLCEALGTGHTHDTERFEMTLSQAMEQGLVNDAVVAKSEHERQALWRIRDSVDQCFRYGPPFLYDVSLAIRDMETYVHDVKQRLSERYPTHHCFTFGHLGDGNIHFAIEVGSAAEDAHEYVNACVYEPLHSIGGSISAEHGIGTEKLAYLPLSREPAELALMRRLKAALDPKGILNPGKVFPLN
ncbi:MAG: FAD-binding oxidoreductase [Gammaproteobacteria bacterium]